MTAVKLDFIADLVVLHIRNYLEHSWIVGIFLITHRSLSSVQLLQIVSIVVYSNTQCPNFTFVWFSLNCKYGNDFPWFMCIFASLPSLPESFYHPAP